MSVNRASKRAQVFSEIHLRYASIHWRFLPALGLMVFLIAGCKTNSAVGMRMVLPPGAQVMSIPKNQGFLMATPVSQPMPVFPADTPTKVSTSVCVELVISESGGISSAIPLYALPECPQTKSQLDQRFVQAAVEAAMKWQFLAAATCVFPAETPMTDDCSGEGVMITPVPIMVSYVFSFQSGQPVRAKTNRAR